MKKVFSSNSQLAHAWANQLQPEGRASNMFFKGPVIYSYGHHYEIARLITAPNGENVCFVNSNGYSNSTAKHTRHVLNAIPDNILTFQVPFNVSGGYWHKEQTVNIQTLPHIVSRLVNMANDKFLDQIRAKNCSYHYEQGLRYLINAQTISQKFNINESFFCEYQIEAEEKAINLENTKQERENKKAQRELEKSRELLTKWLNNEYNGQLYNLPVHLRISKDGKLIETTKGARVEMSEALQLLKKLRGSENVKGDQIGGFTVIDNNEQAVKIGCHVIGWDIINNFFK